MVRETVTEIDLLKAMNVELLRHDACDICHFWQVQRVPLAVDDGCNWAGASLKCTAVTAVDCYPGANKVIAWARERYNLQA